MASTLLNDTAFELPNLTVVSASAGSGKTHTLTMRYLQLLLSTKISNNKLRNILAITFTNNAANEMKGRILSYLKGIILGDTKITAQVQEIVSLTPEQLINRAGFVLSFILEHYSDFQVKTIDSFLISVFRTTGTEQGYHSDTEILLESQLLLNRVFEELALDARENPDIVTTLMGLVELMEQSVDSSGSYLWNPYKKMEGEVTKLYSTLRQMTKRLAPDDHSKELKNIANAIVQQAKTISNLLNESKLELNSFFKKDIDSAVSGDVEYLLGKTRKEKFFNKPKKGSEQRFEQYDRMIRNESDHFYELLSDYILVRSRTRYFPYVRILSILEEYLAGITRREGIVALADVNRILKEYLSLDIVPEVYFKLGENIHHYLIDEFQDTSPIQWEAIKPLLEETLSSSGSLFVVGDTKQSIYSFRGGDWKIMKRLAKGEEFVTVQPEILQLGMNFRSDEQIVRFNDRVFTERLPETEFRHAGEQSGLIDFTQEVKPEKMGKGFVRVIYFHGDEEPQHEQQSLINFVQDCFSRGYRNSDVAILTPSNDKVVAISSWLNEEGIPFISHSSLDIRSRNVVAGLLALLRFLDSPIDELAFTSFLLSEVLTRRMKENPGMLSLEERQQFVFTAQVNDKSVRTLYRLFEVMYPEYWKQYFQDLFAGVGYMPLYDLVTDAIKRFHVFELFPEEEASLAKFLEVVQQFEQTKSSNLKEFLASAEDSIGGGVWDIDVPATADAVKVMTIHKAKGLDFPVVIVLLPDKSVRFTNPVIHDRGDFVELLHVTKTLGEKCSGLEVIYNEQILDRQTDELNKLYVALTRAKHELYVIVTREEETKGTVEILDELEMGTPLPNILHPAGTAVPKDEKIIHHNVLLEAPFREQKRGGMDEVHRGEIIHEIFSKIIFADDTLYTRLPEIIQNVLIKNKARYPAHEIEALIDKFLSNSLIRKYFLPQKERIVLTEQEYVSNNGHLHRCDRIVIDTDTVTVIDYKTGSDELEEQYLKQVKEYMVFLKEVYHGKAIAGIILYVDLNKSVEVV